MQFTFYNISKAADNLVQGTWVDYESINQIKSMIANDRKSRIVLVPMYKSFADALVLFYINYFYDLDMGFLFGMREDIPTLRWVDRLSRRIGLIIMSQSGSPPNSRDSIMKNYVNRALFQEIL